VHGLPDTEPPDYRFCVTTAGASLKRPVVTPNSARHRTKRAAIA
jgi:hypothetical protein